MASVKGLADVDILCFHWERKTEPNLLNLNVYKLILVRIRNLKRAPDWNSCYLFVYKIWMRTYFLKTAV